MSYQYIDGIAVDKKKNISVTDFAPPGRDMKPHGYNSKWGMFEDNSNGFSFHFPYLKFVRDLRAGYPSSKFKRYVFLRKEMFYSYLAASIDDGRIDSLREVYKNFLKNASLLDESAPPYVVFNQEEFYKFVLDNIPKAILESQNKNFDKILATIVDAFDILAIAGGRNAASISKVEIFIVDGEPKFDTLKDQFDRDSEILISTKE